MSNYGVKKSSNGYASKCPGIPMYPNQHNFKIKNPQHMTEEYIRSREKRVEKFLKEFFQDFPDEG